LTASSALGAAVSAGHAATGRGDLADPTKFLSDGISQLTMGSFQVCQNNQSIACQCNTAVYFACLDRRQAWSQMNLKTVITTECVTDLD